MNSFCSVATALLAAGAVTVALAQQTSQGIVSDWTDRHVIFSNPGTFQDATRNGKFEDWLRIVTDPRYRMQQIRRNVASAAQVTDATFGLPESSEDEASLPIFEDGNIKRRPKPLHADWSVALAGGSGNGTLAGRYPAKYTFSPVGSPNCTTDFVVFPISVGGVKSTQASILGVNNLYSGTCTGTVPTVLFAYFVGTGDVQTSPVLSLDGTKVAFVESITNGSVFHVLTLDKSGNSGCPGTPCNGSVYSSPATPGTSNSAVDTKMTMSGNVTVSISSPFVNYTGDIAYVGDDTGKLHKFTGVFKGTPAEVKTAPWPFTVASGVTLTGPVFDGGTSQNILIGGSNSKLYCVTSAGAACSTASITVGTGAILDAPIVDSTAETVFAAANNSANAVLVQATTALGSQVTATMGVNGTDVRDGAFDNAYFTSISTGHMYFCGNLTSAATPTLWRVTFNTSGKMSGSNDGNSFQLVGNTFSGTSVDCTPLTEVFNTAQNKDYLFLGVDDHGFSSGTPNCQNQTCVMSFALPTSSPFTFPTGANATTFGGNLGTLGMSGFIIDNVSSTTGASQIYFGDLQNNTGVQASQSALQ